MKRSTYKNPMCDWYRATKLYAKKNNRPIFPAWETWMGFVEWAETHGYDDNSKFHYSKFNPFAPEYILSTRVADRDCEYIAYEADDPYELIIASAPYPDELAEILNRMGYEYTSASIHSALSRNKDDRPVEDRERGLIFEKIDLSNYEEDDEPFEERKEK